MQLSDLRLVEPKLDEQGFEIVFLSTDRTDILYSSLKATDIHYTLLSDSHLESAKAFHVAYHLDDATYIRPEISVATVFDDGHRYSPTTNIGGAWARPLWGAGCCG
jgi:peroxiredoxin